MSTSSTVRRNIIACYISDIVLGTFFQLPIWIVYQSRFLNYSQIAFYSGLSLIVEVVAQLPSGAFADLYGRKLSLSLGNLFMAIPMFLIALYPKPEIMVVYSIMWGLGRAFCMGTSKPILYETLATYEKTNLYPKILSRSVILFQLSAAISIVSGGYLYLLQPNLPYIVSGLASLIGVFTAFIFVEKRVINASSRELQFLNTAKSGLAEIFKNSYVSKLTILYALTLGIAQTSQQFFMQPFMLELGLSDIARSWTAMIIKISISLLGAKLLATTKIFNSKYFLLIIPTLLVISLMPAGFAKLPWAYLIFIGIAFNSGNTDLFLSAEINAHLTSKVRSTAVSIQRMLASTFGAFIQWLSIVPIAISGVGTYYSHLGIFALFVILPLGCSLAIHKHRYNLDTLSTLEMQSLQK